MSLNPNTFVLRYFNFDTGALISELEIEEPKGFKELEFTLQRDTTVHGVFFEYSSEIEFYEKGSVLDQSTGKYVLVNAYQYLKDIFNIDGYRAIVQLFITHGTSTLFNLFLDFKSLKDNINEYGNSIIFKGENKTPFLLKEQQEKEVELSTFRDIRLRRTTILKVDESKINKVLGRVEEGLNMPSNKILVPPFEWLFVEFDNANITSGYDDQQFLFSSQLDGQNDYEYDIRLDVLYSYSGGIVVPDPSTIFKINKIDSLGVTNIVTQTDPGTAVPFGVFTLYKVTYLLSGVVTLNQFDRLQITFEPNDKTTSGFVTNFWEMFDAFSGLTSGANFFNLTLRDVFNGSASTSILLKDAFNDVLSDSNFLFSSSDLNDITDLGSISITNGRRIAREVDELQLTQTFKGLFEQSQKLFNLGYRIEDNTINIEKIDKFYTENVFEVQEAGELEIELFEAFVFNNLKVGYTKFDTEDLGIRQEGQSFNSNREYNVSNSPFSNTKDVRVNFIASNFIIDKQRRRVNIKEGNDLFIIALNRETTSATSAYSADATPTVYGPLEVAEGFEPFNNASNDYFGLDNESLINIRLSPARIARRYAPQIISSFFKLSSKILEYRGGDPKTELKTFNNLLDFPFSTFIIENENIDFINEGFNTFFLPIKYKISSYFTKDEFLDLKNNNLYDKFQFTVKGDLYAGYILKIDYSFQTELADIELIATNPFDGDFLLLETGDFLLQENGDKIIL